MNLTKLRKLMNLEGDKLKGNNYVCQVYQNNLKVLNVNLGEDNVNKLPRIHTLNKASKFKFVIM
jgi:hypothetical protein